MTKLLVLPLMLASTAGIIGSTAAEAKPRMFHSNPGPGGGDFINVPRPRKRCTRKNPCSPMPELFDFGTPMPRGGLRR
jgi:hypothetical protein